MLEQRCDSVSGTEIIDISTFAGSKNEISSGRGLTFSQISNEIIPLPHPFSHSKDPVSFPETTRSNQWPLFEGMR